MNGKSLVELLDDEKKDFDSDGMGDACDPPNLQNCDQLTQEA